MARLPDVSSLGARPVPRSNRAIATQRNAGVIGDAASGLGNQIAGIGQGIIEKEDKLNYAAARAELLKADVEARAELENDPDFETFDKRYSEKMQAARQNASNLIKSRSDRSLFEANALVDLERGKAEIGRLANGKRVTAGRATLYQGLDNVMDVSRGALDNETRAAAITSANELIDGAVSKGLLDPLEALDQKEKFAGSYVFEQAQLMINREDMTGAQAYLALNQDKLTSSQYLQLEGRLKGALDFRQAVSDAEAALGYVSGVPDPTDGPSMGTMIAAIATQESQGQHFDERGRVKRSSAGAVGVMQVMPGTGPEAAALSGLEWDPKRFESDPAYNKALGTAYFKEMLRQFGDPIVAAAAYNAGPGRVRNALKKGAGWLDALPAETQDYVDKFKERTGARQTAKRWDKESAYANIDAMADAQDWSLERRERAKEYADKQISRDEELVSRKENEAMRAALDVVDGLGDKFTDVSQIPNFSDLSPDDRMRLRGQAEQNRKPKEVPGNGDTAIGLGYLAIRDPDAFMAEDLRKYRGQVTRAEFESLVLKQAKMQEDGPTEESIRGGITSTINLLATEDMKLAGRENRGEFLKVYSIMETEIRALTGGKRKPTDAEYNQAFQSATRSIAVTYDTSFLGIGTGQRTSEKPRYQLEAGDIPASVRQRIERDYVRVYGSAPDDEKVAEIFRRYKGVRW